MIADAPLAAADNVEGVLNRIHAFIATAQSAAADGLTWVEFGELMVALMRMVVSAIDSVTTMTGPDKKALVLMAVGNLFDVVADRCVPLWLWPVWTITRSPIRALVVALASGAVEALLPLVRSATT